MRTRRIELEGSHGHVTIDRDPGSRLSMIRIESCLNKPRQKDQARMSWEVPARISSEDLFEIAEAVQRRCDGSPGTNSMVHDYYRELQRFAD
jgi:hypothetical protein